LELAFKRVACQPEPEPADARRFLESHFEIDCFAFFKDLVRRLLVIEPGQASLPSLVLVEWFLSVERYLVGHE